MKTRLKLNGFIIFFSVLLVVIFPKIFFRNNRIDYIDDVAEMLGIALILLGQIFRVSARGYKAEHSQEGNALIQGGPYSLVRNPMYLGILMIGLGVMLMLFNWWAVSIFLVVFVIRYIFLIFKEEKKLMSIFPKECGEYYKRVPRRIIPSLSKLIKTDIAECLPVKLIWFKKEIGSILAVLLGTMLFESWQDIRSEGLRIYLKEAAGMVMIVMLFMIVIIYLSKRTMSRENNATNKLKAC